MSKSIADISLANDLVFSEVMRQPKNVRPFLEAVLEKKIAAITYIERQRDFKDGINLHGIRLDVALADADETRYDIERQTGHAYDLERRVQGPEHERTGAGVFAVCQREIPQAGH